MKTYTVKEIMDYIEKYEEVSFEYYNKRTKESRVGTFNMIYFDAKIKDEFGTSQLCVSYTDGYTIYYPTPISQITKIYERQ